MNNINSCLIELGFEEREINIYIFLIKNNESTALQISKGTEIDRTTIYDLLEKLIQKRIVFSIIKNKTKHFFALKPKDLLSHYEDKYSSLKNIMPDLNQFVNEKHESVKSEFFYGLEGLKVVLKDFVKAKANYKIIGIREEYEQTLGYFVEQGIIQLNHFNVKEEALVEEGYRVKKLKNSTHRFIKRGVLSPFTTVIYNKIVLFVSWKKPYFIIRIENSAFCQSQIDQFNILWERAKK